MSEVPKQQRDFLSKLQKIIIIYSYLHHTLCFSRHFQTDKNMSPCFGDNIQMNCAAQQHFLFKKNVTSQYVLLGERSKYFIVSRLEGAVKVLHCLDFWLAIKFGYNQVCFWPKGSRVKISISKRLSVMGLGEGCREQSQFLSREHRNLRLDESRGERRGHMSGL